MLQIGESPHLLLTNIFHREEMALDQMGPLARGAAVPVEPAKATDQWKCFNYRGF